MEHLLPREILWEDKTTMGDFLKEPLNQKLYQLYLNIKRKSPSQDFHTLQLFNEVYYLCSRIVYENTPNPDILGYVSLIKKDMGWDYPTSIVLNMIYTVLALRRGNSNEVKAFLEKMRSHYRMDTYKTPFTHFVEEEQRGQMSYDVIGDVSDIPMLTAGLLPLNNDSKTMNITLNINNNFSGAIQKLQVDHADVAVGVAEAGANVYHHNEYKNGRK